MVASGRTVAPLAARDGVAPSRVWLAAGPWATVGQFLIARFPHVAASDLSLRLAQGDIVDSTGQAVAFDSPYAPLVGQWLWYYRVVPNETPVPFSITILYADEHLIAIDKPHFLATTPGGLYLQHTALTRLRRQFNDMNISPLHRLDRETAGVLLFCRQPALRGAYQTLFQQQQVQREYEAVAPTTSAWHFPLCYYSRIVQPKQQLFMQEVSSGGGKPNSFTEISVIEWGETHSLYRLRPLTGRKHQLRMHLSAMGIPICHDSYYPQRSSTPVADDYNKPLQLLARRIAFTDPISGQQREFTSQRQLVMA